MPDSRTISERRMLDPADGRSAFLSSGRWAATQAGLTTWTRGDRARPATEDFGKYAAGYRGRVRSNNRKTTVEECLDLSGCQLASMPPVGILRWNNSSISYAFVRDLSLLRLTYSTTESQTNQQQSRDYFIRVATTQPRFGGLRWWFICPLIVSGVVCNRHVGKLYMPPRGQYFGCRHCYRLTYASRQASRRAGFDPREI
jgi:hypothetical protein